MTYKQPSFIHYVVMPCLEDPSAPPVPPPLADTGPIVALLIDGENCPPSLAAAALAEAEKHGPVCVRRVYGNWAVTSQRWIEPVARYHIQPIHHGPAAPSKNAIDIALVVDAMDLLYAGVIGCFCLVASDSDYTPLVARLRAAGRTVVVLGRANTPQALVEAGSLFVMLEQTGTPTEPPASDPTTVVTHSAPPQTVHTPMSATASTATPEFQTKAPASQPVPAQPSQTSNAKQTPTPQAQDKKLRALLRKAWDKALKQDGWLFMGTLGQHLKQTDPAFSPKAYGYSRLGLLLEAHTDLFRLRPRNNGQYDVQLIGFDKR